MKHLAFLFLFLGLVPVSASSTTAPSAMIEFAQAHFERWVAVPLVIDAIRRQNLETADLTEDDILHLDQTWRDEVTGEPGPMVTGAMTNALSVYLISQVAKEADTIKEVFIMDARGLNVGQNAPTSDYWQGDEAKFSETFGKGPGAIHASAIELDESTQAYQGQISFSIVDPDTGAVIGAVTFGLRAEPFFRSSR